MIRRPPWRSSSYFSNNPGSRRPPNPVTKRPAEDVSNAVVKIVADVLGAYAIGEPVVGDVVTALARAGWLRNPAEIERLRAVTATGQEGRN